MTPCEESSTEIRLQPPSPTVQRRAYFRSTFISECGIVVRLWRIPSHAVLRDRPLPSQQVKADVVELSKGGMGLSISLSPGKNPGLIVDQRLRVFISLDEHETLLDGRIRHLRTNADGSIRAGVQFRVLDQTIEGRQAQAQLELILGRLCQLNVREAKKSA